MNLTIRNIKRWYMMLCGKSIWHVNQDLGKCFAVDSIQGYYNNLTEKVTKLPELLENDLLPLLNTGDKNVEMPVAIFQYGLGAYDLYLQRKEQKYMKKFMQSVAWAVNRQDEKGRWDTFSYVYPDHPYGAMAQGEGASLLLRAYSCTSEKRYLLAAKKAIDFMLRPIEEGGTTLYRDNDIIFAEYIHLPIVLNGWIFAWWGLYDYVLVTHDMGDYKNVLDRCSATLVNSLHLFTLSYWSKYDLGKMIASPFYHNLHIAQMQAMYELTGEKIFYEYKNRWTKQQKSLICISLAFVKKAFQKLLE